MTASLKIRQLELKISDLQTQHQTLLKERQQEIAVLLSAIDLAHFDDKILLGGLPSLAVVPQIQHYEHGKIIFRYPFYSFISYLTFLKM